MNIESDYSIWQIRDRVFTIGTFENFLKLKNNRKIYNDIANVLNKGNKFIPSIYNNNFSFLLYLKYFFSDYLSNFNKKIFYLNSKYRNKQITSLDDLTIKDPIDQDTDFMEKILKKLYQNKRIVNELPLQCETIDLEFEIYKEFSNLKFKSTNNNISFSEFKSIKYFIKNKPFKVVACDKNVGSAMIPHSIYSELNNKHLDNIENFEKIEINPLEKTQTDIIKVLTDLKINNNISNRLLNGLLLKKYKLGTFNILPKLHKSKFGTRPIINCIKHPTSNLSQFIDSVLQPYVQSSTTFIKDSQHLIQDLEDLTLPENTKLCSFDFESLYSNIDLKDALIVITNFMSDKITSKHFDTYGFYHILKLIFENNIFSFNKFFYKQVKGVAMGSKCGPTIANIYLYCLEKRFLNTYNPIYYKRFIDDIFAIFSKSFDTNLLTHGFFKNLVLNEVCSEVVNFLDLNVSIDKLTNKINFSLYIKPTNTFSYLLSTSNHPNFVFDNIPKGILIRIKRICTSLVDFLYFSNKILIQLKSRGYEVKKVLKTIRTLAILPRSDFLEYKTRTNHLSTDFKKINIFICKFYDNNLSNINTSLQKILLNLCDKYSLFKFIKFNIVSKMQPSLGAMIINGIFSKSFDTNLLTHGFFKNLVLNEVCSEVVNFLDLNVSIDKLTNKINFSLYIKPTNTFSYLLSTSNHPNFVFDNIPKGILIRIKRICTSLVDFLYFSNKILIQLKSRGYEVKKVLKTIRTLAILPRSDFLEYKTRTNHLSTDFKKINIFICKFYDNNLSNINTSLQKILLNLCDKYSLFKFIKFNIVSKMQPSLGAMIINGIFSQNFSMKFFNYKKCNKTSCKLCIYSDNSKYLYLPKNGNFFLPITTNATCTSSQIVYIIKCIKCNVFYIGETGRTALVRIREHICNIKKFIPFEERVTSVSQHFNLKGHTPDDFKFIIISKNLEISSRIFLEKKLIYLFQLHKINIINTEFPNIYSNNLSIRI